LSVCRDRTALAIGVIGVPPTAWGIASHTLLRNARVFEIPFCSLVYQASNGCAGWNPAVALAVDPLTTAAWHSTVSARARRAAMASAANHDGLILPQLTFVCVSRC